MKGNLFVPIKLVLSLGGKFYNCAFPIFVIMV